MGFHIIIFKEGNGIEHCYVNSYDRIVDVQGLKKDSIIYQGEENWCPVVVGESEVFKNFTEDWYRASIKAQRIFQKQAEDLGFILEVINQDQESFRSYTKVAKASIKRSDFIIRNATGIEVEVKCRSFWTINNERYFDFNKDEFNKHLNMMEHTQTPVIIAVYKRSYDQVKEDQLFMFEVEELGKNLTEIEIIDRPDAGLCYRIPLGKTKKGFRIIEKYRNKTKNSK